MSISQMIRKIGAMAVMVGLSWVNMGAAAADAPLKKPIKVQLEKSCNYPTERMPGDSQKLKQQLNDIIRQRLHLEKQIRELKTQAGKNNVEKADFQPTDPAQQALLKRKAMLEKQLDMEARKTKVQKAISETKPLSMTEPVFSEMVPKKKQLQTHLEQELAEVEQHLQRWQTMAQKQGRSKPKNPHKQFQQLLSELKELRSQETQLKNKLSISAKNSASQTKNTEKLTAPRTDTGSISGTVTDSNGNGIEGIKVEVIDYWDWTYYGEAITDNMGNYLFTSLLASECCVRFSDDTNYYATEWYDNKTIIDYADPISITAGQITSGIDAQLARGGTITGTVTDSNGIGIQSIKIVIYDQNEMGINSDYSDESGVYSIPALPAGNYKIWFDCSYLNYLNEWYNNADSVETADWVNVEEGQTVAGIDAQLAVGGTIKGKVTDSQGNPLQSVYLNLYDINDNYVAYLYPDAQGNYQQEGLNSGSYKLSVNPNGLNYLYEVYNNQKTLEHADIIPVTTGQTTENINVQLEQGGIISGQVMDKNGVGIENIEICALDEHGYCESCAISNNQGFYTIYRLATANYKIQFQDFNDISEYLFEWYNKKDSYETADWVSVSAGQTTSGINAQLTKGGIISGTVTDSQGNALSGIWADAYDTNENYSGAGLTDETGAFMIHGLSTGEYKIKFYSYENQVNYLAEWFNDKPSFETADAISVTAEQTTSGIDAQLAEGGIITGIVTDKNGAGIEGIEVSICDLNENWLDSAFTDESGNYALNKLQTGHYKIRFYADNILYFSEWYNDQDSFYTADAVMVTSGQTTAGIDAQLTEGAMITGTVTDKDGMGIESIQVIARDLNNNWINEAYTDTSGVYHLYQLQSGTYKVEFDSNGQNYNSEWFNDKVSFETADVIEIVVGQTITDINAQLEEGGIISGTVTDSNGNPISDIDVSIYDINDNYIQYQYTDANGFYEIKGFSSAQYKVSFISYGQNYIYEAYNNKSSLANADLITVTAGQTTGNINAELQTGGMIGGKVIDINGNPIPYTIRIQAFNLNNQFISSSYTDDQGNYSVKGLSSGQYKLYFEHDYYNHYYPEWYNNQPSFELADPITVTTGQSVENINVQLQNKGIISGKVTDTNGNSIAGIMVLVYNPDNYIETVYTDETRMYSVMGLDAGEYKIEFLPQMEQNYLQEWYNKKTGKDDADIISLMTGQIIENINAQLDVGGIISGKVTDINGFPLQAVEVQARSWDHNYHYALITETDINGEYSIKGLFTGQHKICFYPYNQNYLEEYYNKKDSWETADSIPVTVGQITANIDAQLKPGGKITGKVNLAGISIIVYSRSGKTFLWCTNSDNNGNYTIHGLKTGYYTVFYDAQYKNYNTNQNWRYQWYKQADTFAQAIFLEVIEDQTTIADPITLTQDGATINGLVSNGEQGILDCVILAFSSRFDLYYSILTIHTEGKPIGYYSITGLPPGEYFLYFYDFRKINFTQFYPGVFDIAQAKKVCVSSNQVINGIDAILSESGTISGQVMNGSKGIKCIEVQLLQAENDKFPFLRWIFGKTDSQGNYKFEKVPPGNWKVLFTPNTDEESIYQAQFYPQAASIADAAVITVTAGGHLENIDADLAVGGGKLHLTVKGVQGLPIENATAELYLAGQETLMGAGRTDENGEIQFSGVIPGEYKVLVHHFLLEPTEWYSDANSFADAKVITVTDGQTQSIAMVLGGPDEKPRESIVAVFPGEGLWVMDYQEDGTVSTEQWSKQQPDRIRLGDVDGNGIADLAGWFKAKNEFWVRFDSGVWQKWPADAVNMIAFDLADINNDGVADIVGSWTHGNWWRDAASGVWERLSKQSPTFLAAGDFEGDGLMDVVGLYPELSSIWIYSRLATPQWKKISNQINLNDLRSADINADGRSEVLGSWDIGTWTFDYIANTWERHSAKPASVLCAGDIDGQGKKDIIGDWSPSIPGLWVKFMETNTWKRLSSKIPSDLCSGQVK